MKSKSLVTDTEPVRAFKRERERETVTDKFMRENLKKTDAPELFSKCFSTSRSRSKLCSVK